MTKHPLLTILALIVVDGSLDKLAEVGEHGLLHLTQPVLHVATCLQALKTSNSHMTEFSEQTDLIGCILGLIPYESPSHPFILQRAVFPGSNI